jgi:hypothetical protein
MVRGGGRVVGSQGMHAVTDSSNAFLVLRTSKLVEIVGPGLFLLFNLTSKPLGQGLLDQDSILRISGEVKINLTTPNSDHHFDVSLHKRPLNIRPPVNK